MGAKQSTCKNCGRKFPTETMFVVNGKKYCVDCAKSLKKDADNYKKLCAYIYENMYNKNCNMPLITTQIKRLHEKEEFSYQGMLTTLQYIYEIVEINQIPDPAVGITSLMLRYYWEAKNFYIKKSKINKEEQKIYNILSRQPEQVNLNRSDIIKKDLQEQQKKEIREHRVLIDANQIVDDFTIIDF